MDFEKRLDKLLEMMGFIENRIIILSFFLTLPGLDGKIKTCPYNTTKFLENSQKITN